METDLLPRLRGLRDTGVFLVAMSAHARMPAHSPATTVGSDCVVSRPATHPSLRTERCQDVS